uniref:Decapping nuclease n=1 Tax=Prasinoderma coloniale TaxID=156133 RepID=A0A7R9TYR1_9VIRI|mmetsp:Transcript_8511/g.34586  ORF Transcript_8511/g.34586 Transcript_8511/m.34586 type:complete len:485 (+) Transcript_8511:67-1521(+)
MEAAAAAAGTGPYAAGTLDARCARLPFALGRQPGRRSRALAHGNDAARRPARARPRAASRWRAACRLRTARHMRALAATAAPRDGAERRAREAYAFTTVGEWVAADRTRRRSAAEERERMRAEREWVLARGDRPQIRGYRDDAVGIAGRDARRDDANALPFGGPATAAAAVLTAPQEIACWTHEATRGASDDAVREVLRFGDRSGLRELRSPRTPLALCEEFPVGLVAGQRFERERAPDEVLRALAWARVPLSDVRVASHRRPLAQLLETAALPARAWTFDACLIDGTLFLNEAPAPQLPAVAGASARELRYLRAVYASQRFEAACTTPSGDVAEAASTEFFSLVGFHLGPFAIACASEVDAVDPRTGEYVELKLFASAHADAAGLDDRDEGTRAGLGRQGKCDAQRRAAAATRKLLLYRHPRWWAQCVLSGVSEVRAGAIDEHDVLRAVRHVRVGDLAAMSTRGLRKLRWHESRGAQGDSGAR